MQIKMLKATSLEEASFLTPTQLEEIKNWEWNDCLPQYGRWYSHRDYTGLNINSIPELNVLETDEAFQFERFLTLDNERDLNPAAKPEWLITYAFVIIGDAQPGFNVTEFFFDRKITRKQAPSWSDTTQVVLVTQILHNKAKWRLLIYSGDRNDFD